MKTYSAKQNEVPADWYVVDAADKTLGRMASEIAFRLRGKHKPEFTPHMDVGDHIVVINAQQVRTTGAKSAKKIYYRHTGYPGNMKSMSLANRLEQHPERVIRDAVTRMLPTGPLGRQMARKLRVYASEDHPHTAQQPQALEF
ncbi:50S ribosomal protein L13 [Salinisphaera sp. USBA-960]|uniref:50S ribosomal protein L13 n=1 Tax=Salinisphaera orenii TaxID=856731 RepID=UPI000DBE92E2|nr:50S ribosomal protein L13 [Salifodinibacter halophilus]NNC27181.1 50S ribosomal protein L13 [Salifodinibacter halophilus]